MRKSISILELDYHPEVLKHLVEIISEISEIDFHIYTSSTIFKKTGLPHEMVLPNISLFLNDDATSKHTFLVQHIERINLSSLIYFNTLDSDYDSYLSFGFSPPMCMRIHNANTFLKESLPYRPVVNLLVLYKNLSYFVRKVLFKNEIVKRRMFLKLIDYFVFPSESAVQYALANFPSKRLKIYPKVLPLVYSSSIMPTITIDSDVTTIAIVGTVDSRRRDYRLVINTLKKLRTEKHSKLHIYLLGRPVGQMGKNILKEFMEVASPLLEITTFNSFVPETLFEEIMYRSDFLLIPLHMRPRFTLFDEIYGLTKVSGNVNDAIFYGKRAILNKHYHLDPSISRNFLLFETEDELRDLLLAIEQHKHLSTDYKSLEKATVVTEYRNAFNAMISRIC